MNDASDYVVVHEEGSLQRLPWLSQPSCLVFGDAVKKGGRWLDVPRRNAGVRTPLHLSDNVAVSTSIGQETAKRQSPRQPVRQISAQQADDTQLESCSWVAVPARVHPHLTRPLDAVVHPPQWRLISTARPLPELGSGTKNTHGIIRMHETENHQHQNRY